LLSRRGFAKRNLPESTETRPKAAAGHTRSVKNSEILQKEAQGIQKSREYRGQYRWNK
jgi:hypothetical protein